MNLNILNPRRSLNKAFLKVKPNKDEIQSFKIQIKKLIENKNEKESEEFHKNLIANFLKKVYFDPNYFINTKGKNDLVIHNGSDAKSSVGVIIEAKSPSNKFEMPKKENINVKALQELVLYYLRERISNKNLEVTNLVITNINEWFIFDANLFEKEFASNKILVKQFQDFEDGRLSGKTTDFFYKEIASPAIDSIQSEISFTYFKLSDFESLIISDSTDNDVKLIPLFKIFSPEFFLKLPFQNDSNTLNNGFYKELLHIVGLTEQKIDGKKRIGRKTIDGRDGGALLESAIGEIESLDKLSQVGVDFNRFGKSTDDRLFNIGLELVITWVNRIIFLKLLEAQLVTYHNNDKEYEFLNIKRIASYDDLNDLFFKVLARKPDQRTVEIKKLFSKIPYLNSSLFAPTDVEHKIIFISNLKKGKKLRILPSTVLRSENGKKRTGEMDALEYFFEFLNAYDFASEGSEQIREHNKSLINASVLGLIFENINGYKDGSFFTPGFITMYICRETIRAAVISKFNEIKSWNCKNINELYDHISDRNEANSIVNSLKICDPAVGSGHFLVSALNEIISVKNDLKILQDRDGRRLKEYSVEVVNDELIITDDDGSLFSYSPKNPESQRVQEAIFYEKQTIIENCLFGVDINPNSVKICHLRLWIELLKSAFYKKNFELETLPNIDINIKVGNSLISRFELDSDLKKVLKKTKRSLVDYKLAVATYRNASSKEEKHNMEELIDTIKADFRTEILSNDPKLKRKLNLTEELTTIRSQKLLFEETLKQKKLKQEKIQKIEKALKKVSSEIDLIKNSKLYENAFEWRFEFPEILDDSGNYLGFDALIGNPPYISAIDLKRISSPQELRHYKTKYVTAKGAVDIYIYFFELGIRLIRQNFFLAYITPNRYLSASYGAALRKHILYDTSLKIIGDYSSVKVFKEAATYPVVTILSKNPNDHDLQAFTYDEKKFKWSWRTFDKPELFILNDYILGFVLGDKFPIVKRVITLCTPLVDCGTINATSTAAEADNFHNYINESSGFKLINTGTIDKYSTTWGESDLIDKGQKYRRPYLPNVKEILGDNRFNLYSTPKIIFAKIAKTTEAFYDGVGEYSSINTNCIHSFTEGFLPMYVLAWVNSKLFQYIFECFFSGLKMAGGYLLYSAPNLSNLYIMKADDVTQKDVGDKVSRLIENYKSSDCSAVDSLISDIDRIFYKMFDLSEYDIQKIENDLTPSEKVVNINEESIVTFVDDI